jgi:hypothetical protein
VCTKIKVLFGRSLLLYVTVFYQQCAGFLPAARICEQCETVNQCHTARLTRSHCWLATRSQDPPPPHTHTHTWSKPYVSSCKHQFLFKFIFGITYLPWMYYKSSILLVCLCASCMCNDSTCSMVWTSWKMYTDCVIANLKYLNCGTKMFPSHRQRQVIIQLYNCKWSQCHIMHNLKAGMLEAISPEKELRYDYKHEL